MNYTGERMQPGESDQFTFWEHIYRYAFAARHAAGRRVLDVACGCGYGSAALRAAGASAVVGVDVSADACAFAVSTYGVDARVGDAENLPFGAATFDLVASFETIEHLPHPLRFLDECHRVLAVGGEAIISTPNKHLYREITPNNPFHVNELEKEEFERACRERFRRVQLFGQRPLRAPWWSPRVVSAQRWPFAGIRSLDRLRNGLVRLLHRELRRSALARARQDPSIPILRLRSDHRTFANPFAIRPYSPSLDEPVYLIAVCSR